MRTIVRVFVLIAALALASVPTPVAAAQACHPDDVRADDMAGVYEASTMLLVVGRCGYYDLTWVNPYGRHNAGYVGFRSMRGGGYLAVGYRPDPAFFGYLDLRRLLAIKPAEPGYIQIATLDDNYNVDGVYKLRKTR